MSFTKTYLFDTPTNYTFDSNKVEITGSKARLILEDNSGQTFNQPFTNDTGFTYDSSKAEFTGGLVRQIDQRLTDATCWATYTTDIDLSYGDGSNTGTASGGAAVSGNKLDLKGDTIKYVSYDATNNADSQQVGAVRMKFTPNYSGVPTSQRTFFSINESLAVPNNRVQIAHANNGNLQIVLTDQSGVNFTVVGLGLWNPSAGTTYEIEFNWDITTGANRLFVDGVQFGATNTGTGTRSSNIGILLVGTNWNGATSSDMEIEDVIVFPTVQHTANYTPGYTLEEFRYLESKVELPQFSYPGAGSIQAYANLTTTENNNPQQIWNDLYWSGSAWVSSDGTFSQSNTVADIVANIASFPVSDTLDIDVLFNDGSDQMDIDDLTVTYTGQIYPTDNPTVVFNDTLQMEALDSFSEVSTKNGSDEIKYTLGKDGTPYYWSGSAWVSSDGTYAQSNTALEIETNKSTFTTIGVNVEITMFLHSDDGSTTPEADSITVEYDFAGEVKDTIEKCIVYGYKTDALGAVSTDTIIISITDDGVKYKTNVVIDRTTITITPDTNGYWEAELVENENMSPTTVRYDFDFGDKVCRRYVPNQASASFWSLTE